ncbi:MAG: DUF4013 domain-containing protein [Pirellulaceae bacterium]
MSQPDQFGPFTPAPPKPSPGPLPVVQVALPSGPTQLEYLRSFQYIFDNPNWLMNLVWSFLSQLAGQFIPVVPAMVFTGYQFEMLEDLVANRGTRYPDFDINRLGEYLGRGVWPVLVMLVVGLGAAFASILLVVVAMIGIGLIGSAGGDDMAGILAIIGMIGGVLLGIAIFAGVGIYLTPMILKAGLSQEFGAAFDFRWVNDFVGKMWVETLLSMLFIFISVFVPVLLTCGLAGILLGPMMPFVGTHFHYQLYSLYLSRGGMPIPLKPRMPLAPPPGYVPPQF